MFGDFCPGTSQAMSSKTVLSSRSLFDTSTWVAYLDTAAEGLPLRAQNKPLSEVF